MNPKQTGIVDDPDGPNTTMAPKPIAADGVPLRSRKHRMRIGKVRGESKMARRMRRRST